MKSERQDCAVAFLKAAIAYDTSLGIKVERVMTDNGSCYKSFAFRKACKRLGLKHIRTKPYTPKTNGKAERFIQTSLRDGPMPAPTAPHKNEPPNCSDVQLAPAAWRYRLKAANQQTCSDRNNLLRLHI